jgi:PPOX class probable F420-dependent enzyme
MSWSDEERKYVASARVGRLATVDAEGRPHAIPICYSLVEGRIVSPLDEKPQGVEATKLRRVRNIRQNPRVTLVVDHYTEEWTDLGWVQIRGTAAVVDPDESGHDEAVTALQEKYDQYEAHALDRRPVIRLDPGTVRSWGYLDHS